MTYKEPCVNEAKEIARKYVAKQLPDYVAQEIRLGCIEPGGKISIICKCSQRGRGKEVSIMVKVAMDFFFDAIELLIIKHSGELSSYRSK